MIDRATTKTKQDLMKPSEQHEGLPGYLDDIMHGPGDAAAREELERLTQGKQGGSEP